MPFIPRIIQFATLIGPATAAFGNAFSTGPTANGNYITYASATLVVPESPNPQVGLLSLWTGMGMSNGDLVQALVESYSGDADYGCGPVNGNWCAWASYLPVVQSQGQQGGVQKQAKVGDHVTLTYIYNTKTTATDQYVSINGKLVSTLSSSIGGKALGYGTAEECQPEYPCGVVPAHDWINMTLILNTPQPSYNQTFGNGGSSGTLISKDGKTWHSDRIHINEVDFDFPIPGKTPSCPTAKGSTYTTPTGKVYDITCDTDYDQNDIKVVQVQSQWIADCLVECEQTSKCVGAVMLGSTCHLKSKRGRTLTKKGRQAAMLQGV